MSTSYFWQRLKPFVVFYILVAFCARAALTFYQWPDLAPEGLQILKAFFVGAFFDVAVCAYLVLPLALYLLCLPARLHKTRFDYTAFSILFFTNIYVLFFSGVGEWFFWDEFQTRYNFIAVDYLVYTKEVIGNIRESYPVGPILTALAVLSGLVAYAAHRYTKNIQAAAPRFLQRAFVFVLLCGIAAASFFTVQGKAANISPNRYLNEIARNGIFELFSAFRNNELDYAQFYETLPNDQIVKILAGELGLKNTNAQSPLTRKITATKPEKNYNLIVITVESLSADFMRTFGSTRNITPHLDALAQNSLFFSNLYATGTRTVYGLSALTLAMPPVPGNAIVRRANNGGLATIGDVLRNKNYTTKFIYGGFGYFDNMNAFFGANGYEIVDRTNLTDAEITFANVWGVCDEDLFARVLKESDQEFAAKKPFFNMVMTTSNHRPYTFPSGRPGIPPEGGGREAGIKYTDYAINDFLEKAAQKPWFKNTIFVIAADHTAGSSGRIEIDPSKYHIPVFIYAPSIIKPAKIEKLASQIDVVPTVLDLMGASYTSKFYGQNLLKQSPNRAFVSSYQKLGYLTPEGLVILKPGQQADFYKPAQDSFEKAGAPPESLKNKAIAYYQGASNWRSWSLQPEK